MALQLRSEYGIRTVEPEHKEFEVREKETLVLVPPVNSPPSLIPPPRAWGLALALGEQIITPSLLPPSHLNGLGTWEDSVRLERHCFCIRLKMPAMMTVIRH